MPKKYNISFLHCGDIHLGHRQYGLDQRADDFASTFKWACDEAIKNRVDFVIIAGDLFDHRNVNAKTLEQAVIPLESLHLNGIDVFVIEGNHDRPYYKDKIGWIEYLSDRGLIKHIPFGRFVEWKDVVISNPSVIIESEFVDDKFHIGVMHAGVEGIIPNMSGCISMEDVSKMKTMFHYLALSHIHKPYEIDGFAFNSGSLEHWNISESGWNGGYYLVDVDTKSKKFNAKHVISPKRTMIRIGYHADCGKYDYALADIKEGSIIELTLLGETKDKPDIEYIEKEILDNYPDWLYLKIVDKTTRPNSKPIEITTKDKKDIERDTINDMTKDEKLTDLILEIKETVNSEPEELLEMIKNG